MAEYLASIDCSVFVYDYDFNAPNPEFLEQKELWKNNIKLKARFNIAEGIEKGDKELSKWYAERKCGDEFVAKQKQEINGNINKIIFLFFI